MKKVALAVSANHASRDLTLLFSEPGGSEQVAALVEERNRHKNALKDIPSRVMSSCPACRAVEVFANNAIAERVNGATMSMSDLLRDYLDGKYDAIEVIRRISDTFNPDTAADLFRLVNAITRIEQNDLDKDTFRSVWKLDKKPLTATERATELKDA